MVRAKKPGLSEEIRRLEHSEYGLKEFIHGLLLGLIIGFLIAVFFV